MRSKHRESPRPVNYSVLHWMIFGASVALNVSTLFIVIIAVALGES